MYVNIDSKKRGALKELRKELKRNRKHDNLKSDRNQKKYYEFY